MTTQTEALKLALEALAKVDALCPVGSIEEIYVRDAVYAINEALAQPEQEPKQQQPTSPDVRDALLFCLWHHQGGSSKIGQPIRHALGIGQHDHMTDEQYAAAKRVQLALINEAPQRKPLTDEQKYALIEKHLGLKQRRDNTVIDQYTGLFYSAKPYFDLINEATHGIKE